MGWLQLRISSESHKNPLHLRWDDYTEKLQKHNNYQDLSYPPQADLITLISLFIHFYV